MTAEATPARTRILRATLELIAEGSVDAVTHREVARRAGVSPGSTTHHFANRDQLIRAAYRRYLEVADEKIRSLFDGRTEADPLVHVGDLLATIVTRDFAGGLVRAEYELFLHACNDPELAGEVRAWEGRLIGALAELLEEAGADRPVNAARTLVNLARGFELDAMLDPSLGRADFERRVALVLRGIVGSPR